jgi:hypothetical protein
MFSSVHPHPRARMTVGRFEKKMHDVEEPERAIYSKNFQYMMGVTWRSWRATASASASRGSHRTAVRL